VSTAQPLLAWYEKLIALILMPLLMTIICLPVAYLAYRSQLDRKGWVPHWHRIDVFIQGDWFDGEDRVCTGIQDRTQDGKPIKIGALHCSTAEGASGGGNTDSESGISTHNLSVLFWGRILRSGISPTDEASGKRFSWRCSRRSDWPFGEQFVCRAIN
jgi:hypothetical protein